MVRFVHKEQSEITMDYVNIPVASARSKGLESSSGEDGGVTAAVPGQTEILQFNNSLSFNRKSNMDKNFNFKMRSSLCRKAKEESVSLFLVYM